MSAIERIRAERLVAVLRRVADVDARVAMLADAGVSVVEITLDDPGALDAIERARARGDVTCSPAPCARPSRSTPPCRSGRGGGRRPGIRPRGGRAGARARVPAIPGALTPTEVEAAWPRAPRW